jgi:hypothetical protein
MANSLIRRVVVIVLAIAAAGRAALVAQTPLSLEYEVKGQYLFNFLSFVEWPTASFAQADVPFRLCLAGPDAFSGTLDSLVKGQRVQGHSIVVDRLKDETTVGACQVVFVSKVDNERMAAIAKATEHRSVLLVGETPKLLELCGAIVFVLDGERVRFDISLAGLAAHNLKASSKLLRVAREASDRFSRCLH